MTNDLAAQITPVTTLAMLQNAWSNGTTPIFTVNCRGDGYLLPPVGTSQPLWLITNSTTTILTNMAANWVRYANYIVQHYYWSNSLIIPTNGAPRAQHQRFRFQHRGDLDQLLDRWNRRQSSASAYIAIKWELYNFAQSDVLGNWK
jgi:hypothetical protein